MSVKLVNGFDKLQMQMKIGAFCVIQSMRSELPSFRTSQQSTISHIFRLAVAPPNHTNFRLGRVKEHTHTHTHTHGTHTQPHTEQRNPDKRKKDMAAAAAAAKEHERMHLWTWTSSVRHQKNGASFVRSFVCSLSVLLFCVSLRMDSFTWRCLCQEFKMRENIRMILFYFRVTPLHSSLKAQFPNTWKSHRVTLHAPFGCSKTGVCPSN